MIIYGTAILAICHLLGDYLGNTLGMVLGVKRMSVALLFQ
jgi:malonate transporter MadL subunit